MRRGELWTVAGGVYASKPRPALIVQDDLFAATDSVTVAPLTSHTIDAPLLRYHVAAGGRPGLSHDRDIMIDKLATVWRGNVHTRVGRLSSQQLVDVERLLATFLGLAG